MFVLVMYAMIGWQTLRHRTTIENKKRTNEAEETQADEIGSSITTDLWTLRRLAYLIFASMIGTASRRFIRPTSSLSLSYFSSFPSSSATFYFSSPSCIPGHLSCLHAPAFRYVSTCSSVYNLFSHSLLPRRSLLPILPSSSPFSSSSSSSSSEDLYKVLGVLSTASADEVKLAYKKAALRWHPDRNPTNKAQAEEKFRDIAEAYQTLSDVDKRRMYDLRSRGRGMPEGGMAGFERRGMGDVGGTGGFRHVSAAEAEEIFRQMFGGMGISQMMEQVARQHMQHHNQHVRQTGGFDPLSALFGGGSMGGFGERRTVEVVPTQSGRLVRRTVVVRRGTGGQVTQEVTEEDLGPTDSGYANSGGGSFGRATATKRKKEEEVMEAILNELVKNAERRSSESNQQQRTVPPDTSSSSGFSAGGSSSGGLTGLWHVVKSSSLGVFVADVFRAVSNRMMRAIVNQLRRTLSRRIEEILKTGRRRF
eukprot:GHVS01060479.1.p1 GENE.GHVS01060479.1~~GHVS01060479.1.p1  ORF type:complete len:478 (+),score=128.42 GHVS01060479.1:1363-2796(+)